MAECNILLCIDLTIFYSRTVFIDQAFIISLSDSISLGLCVSAYVYDEPYPWNAGFYLSFKLNEKCVREIFQIQSFVFILIWASTLFLFWIFTSVCILFALLRRVKLALAHIFLLHSCRVILHFYPAVLVFYLHCPTFGGFTFYCTIPLHQFTAPNRSPIEINHHHFVDPLSLSRDMIYCVLGEWRREKRSGFSGRRFQRTGKFSTRMSTAPFTIIALWRCVSLAKTHWEHSSSISVPVQPLYYFGHCPHSINRCFVCHGVTVWYVLCCYRFVMWCVCVCWVSSDQVLGFHEPII